MKQITVLLLLTSTVFATSLTQDTTFLPDKPIAQQPTYYYSITKPKILEAPLPQAPVLFSSRETIEVDMVQIGLEYSIVSYHTTEDTIQSYVKSSKLKRLMRTPPTVENVQQESQPQIQGFKFSGTASFVFGQSGMGFEVGGLFDKRSSSRNVGFTYGMAFRTTEETDTIIMLNSDNKDIFGYIEDYELEYHYETYEVSNRIIYFGAELQAVNEVYLICGFGMDTKYGNGLYGGVNFRILQKKMITPVIGVKMFVLMDDYKINSATSLSVGIGIGRVRNFK